MGALPSGWKVDQLPGAQEGLYIRVGPRLLPLYPLARLGKHLGRLDDVQLFAGARRNVPEYLSIHTWERRPKTAEVLRADLRRALFVEDLAST
jgi:hypothetical protein